MRIFAGIPGQLRVKSGASVAYRNDEAYYVCFLQTVNSNPRIMLTYFFASFNLERTEVLLYNEHIVTLLTYDPVFEKLSEHV